MAALFQISVILSFAAILLLLFIEPTTPVPLRVASQWRECASSYNGYRISSEMAGAPPVGRRPRTRRTTPPNYGRTTLLSSDLVCTWLSQHVAHHLSASCQHKSQDRSSTSRLFCASGLRFVHETPRMRRQKSTLRRTRDVDFSCEERPSIFIHFG